MEIFSSHFRCSFIFTLLCLKLHNFFKINRSCNKTKYCRRMCRGIRQGLGLKGGRGHWQWQQQRKLVRCGCCALAGEFLFWPFVQTDVAKNRCNCCCCWYCCCCYLFHCGRHWVGLVFVAIWLGQKRRGGATFKLF